MKSGSGESNSRRYSATVSGPGVTNGGSGIGGGAGGGTGGGISLGGGSISIGGVGELMESQRSAVARKSSFIEPNHSHLTNSNSTMPQSTAMVGDDNGDGNGDGEDEKNDETKAGLGLGLGLGRGSILLTESTSYDDISMMPRTEEETTRIKTGKHGFWFFLFPP